MQAWGAIQQNKQDLFTKSMFITNKALLIKATIVHQTLQYTLASTSTDTQERNAYFCH